MAHGTVGFFEPTCPITVDSNWEFQDGGAVQNSRTRANELGRTGDEILKRLHNSKGTTSFVFVHKGTGTKYVFPKIGLVDAGWHIDNFSVKWDRTKIAAVMTVNCHKHNGGTAHEVGSCRTYTPSLSNAIEVVAFGVPGNLGAAFALASGAVVDLRDATYTVGAQHVDELNRSGEELKGNNYDGSETLDVNLTGAATGDDYTSEWDQVTDGVTPTKTGATASSFHFENHISADEEEED